MKITEAINLINNTKTQNNLASFIVDEKHRNERLEPFRYMLTILDEHQIPKNESDYIDLLESKLGVECTDIEAKTQIDCVMRVLAQMTVINNLKPMPAIIQYD